jgi:DNA-binding GntR family transcriptional regulator
MTPSSAVTTNLPLELDSVQLCRQQPMREQIYTLLRDRLLTGAIRPGALIDEKSIAAGLNISRTPVHEAVKRLSDENLIVVVAQSATRAAPLHKDHIEEAYLIRRALEMESAAQAASRIKQAHVDKLTAIVNQQAQAIGLKHYASAIGLDDDFHHCIASISNLQRLWRTIEISKAHLDRCRHIMLPRTGEGETTLKHHRRIITALKTGDSDKACAAMRNHLDVAYRSTLTTLDFNEFDFPVEPKPGGRGKLAMP